MIHERPHVHTLTAIRGAAAWWVVVYHFKAYLQPYLPGAAFKFISYGDLAVDLFFCLSGFVIYLNYRKLAVAYPSVLTFYAKRVARIYPLHLTFLLAYAALAIALVRFAHGPVSTVKFGMGAFVAHLLMVQDWGIVQNLAWNIPSWSISAEFAAYLLFPCLLVILRIRQAGLLRLLLSVLAAWALLVVLFRPFEYRLGSGIQEIGALRCLLQFAAGMLACEIRLRYPAALERLGPWLFLAPVAALFAAIEGVPTAWVIPAGWFGCILALASIRGVPQQVIGWSPFVYLGDVSYATYMCHYFVFDIFKLLCVRREGEASLGALVAAAAAVAVLSPLLYHIIERPAQRWAAARLVGAEPRIPLSRASAQSYR